MAAQQQVIRAPPIFLTAIRTDKRCAKCRQIDFEGERSLVHHDYRNLKISAARGCPLCQFLYSEIILRPGVHLKILRDQNGQYPLLIDQGTDVQDVKVTDFFATSRMFEFFCDRGVTHGPAYPLQITYRDVHPHPDAEGCWELANHWLTTCITNHEACREQDERAERRLPTRLLDVTYNRPRLVLTKELSGAEDDASKRYVTLSHCWGGTYSLPTVMSNVASRMKGLDMFDLLPTFRDAVTVTRKLGITYLWIDSICIIQDDVEDWQKESALMSYVYRDSFLNVSALSARDGNGGILNPRPNLANVRLRDHVYIRRARESWGEVFQNSPLSRRAWVLQERLISPRVLHFGDRDMFWECTTCSIRESDEREHTGQSAGFGWTDENFKRSLLLVETPGNVPLDTPYQTQAILARWYQIITQFTRLDITRFSDAFPATSALARRIQLATSYRYVAGIWEGDIHMGLLWYKDRSCRAVDSYIAPSWSWAALPGSTSMLRRGVEFEHGSLLQDPSVISAEILSIDADMVSHDPFGQVKSGSLIMKCVTKQVWYKSSVGQPPYNDWFLKLILDVFDDEGRPLGTGYLDIDRSQGDSMGTCKAVVISEYWEGSENDLALDQGNVLYFLLVEQVETSDTTVQFKRIGIGHTADRLLGVRMNSSPFHECPREHIRLI